MKIKTTKTDNPLSFGLALLGGIGLTIMIVALGLGVVGTDPSTENTVGVLFLLGLLLLIVGVGAWVGVTRPFEHFDDITQAKDTGHGHGSHDTHAADTDHAHADEPAGHALPSGGTSH